jgi:hypothetical protein
MNGHSSACIASGDLRSTMSESGQVADLLVPGLAFVRLVPHVAQVTAT